MADPAWRAPAGHGLFLPASYLTGTDGASTIAAMKKLLILAIIVALGVVAAKRLRPS